MKTFSICSISMLLFLSCITTSAPPPTKHIPNFDFTSSERNDPGSAGITIALLSPQFIDSNEDLYVDPFNSFIGNMKDDFEEMLIAKGFSLRGPFKNADEMVYGDKQASDLALKVSVDLKRDGGYTYSLVYRSSISGAESYRIKGDLKLSGNLVLEAVDPFTGEKFWKKSVSLEPKIVSLNSYKTYNNQNVRPQELLQDVGIYNPIAIALEQYYQNALSTAYRHIDVREMEMVKNEIRQAQKRK